MNFTSFFAFSKVKFFISLQCENLFDMTQEDYQQLENSFLAKIKKINTRFVRYLYGNINWNVRLIGVKGARGVGKTTLLLQRIKLAYKETDTVFYASLDDLWFQSHSLPELVEWLYQRGVRHLFLDEVHKYHDWQIILKNIYDTYGDLNVVYTGSSMLEIDYSRADLSRRQTLYTLHGLSFREYLELHKIHNTEILSLQQLLAEHQNIAMGICKDIPVIKHFQHYLKEGYYPFQIDAKTEYLPRLAEIVRLVIETDMPDVEKFSYATIQKAKQLLMVVANNVPLTPNISKMSSQLETTRDMCLKLLYTLDRADLILLLTKEVKDYKHLVNPEKMYLGNPNLMYALGGTVDVGTLRETFFLSQVSKIFNVRYPNHGDFMVDNTYLFEVGGKSKTFDQIKEIPNSWLAVDDIEIGSRNRIPLWMFGLLY